MTKHNYENNINSIKVLKYIVYKNFTNKQKITIFFL